MAKMRLTWQIHRQVPFANASARHRTWKRASRSLKVKVRSQAIILIVIWMTHRTCSILTVAVRAKKYGFVSTSILLISSISAAPPCWPFAASSKPFVMLAYNWNFMYDMGWKVICNGTVGVELLISAYCERRCQKSFGKMIGLYLPTVPVVSRSPSTRCTSGRKCWVNWLGKGVRLTDDRELSVASEHTVSRRSRTLMPTWGSLKQNFISFNLSIWLENTHSVPMRDDDVRLQKCTKYQLGRFTRKHNLTSSISSSIAAPLALSRFFSLRTLTFG